MPNCEYSALIASEKLFIYILVAEYTVIKGIGWNSDAEEIFIIAPFLRFRICLMTSLVIRVVVPLQNTLGNHTLYQRY
jgi:hypothetical protein